MVDGVRPVVDRVRERCVDEAREDRDEAREDGDAEGRGSGMSGCDTASYAAARRVPHPR